MAPEIVLWLNVVALLILTALVAVVGYQNLRLSMQLDKLTDVVKRLRRKAKREPEAANEA